MKTISEHVLDIVQNSVRAEATLIEIIVREQRKNNLYTLEIIDNGCGMTREVLEQATNPFFTSRSTRKVGLGLSLLKQNAEAAGGSFIIFSEPGKGTKVEAVFLLNHLDRPPLGDIWDTWYLTLLSNPEIRLVYTHQTNEGSFSIDSQEVLKMTDGIPLQQKEMREAILEMIKNNLEEINTSK
ncbi:Histidine kinase-, DNA gyrase B-, and HSP90-like ATPase [Mariniphaga anaerophila]|uniref:histidine kinase n=1 Tax=Mariniphaga anaerophila TaxID=1484053 RepID=A0A1M4TTS0_9BACT|nr:ATP-binding protein [Mariniphaga anaerophila]SHE47828.1 Histidine kinase-, DNA gyrase B-, and HSP90-like ATPase [Mariniphaga anaerophila]